MIINHDRGRRLQKSGEERQSDFADGLHLMEDKAPAPQQPLWLRGLLALAGIFALILILSNAFPQQIGDQEVGLSVLTAVPVANTATGTILTPEERRDLLFMAEEEKMARDVYRAMYRKWKLSQFNSIARSEEQHVASVVGLLQKYSIPDPVTGSEEGRFQDPHITALYRDLISKGSQSSIAAMQVGGLIEEVDILDLENALQVARQPDIRQVYTRIQRGSFNHLRAYAHALELVGHPYQPSKLSNDSFQSIIHSPMQPGF